MVTKEMLERFTRPLTSTEITWMIQFSGKTAPVGKTRIIPYITARCANDRLREDIGIGNYQTKYREIGKTEAGYICTVSLLCDSGWCSYEEGASNTKIEPNKGGISSALKRTVMSLGLGRELYNFPVVHLKGNKLEAIPSEYYPLIEKLTNDIILGIATKNYYLLEADSNSETEKAAQKLWINKKTDLLFETAKQDIMSGSITSEEQLIEKYAFNSKEVLSTIAKKDLVSLIK